MLVLLRGMCRSQQTRPMSTVQEGFELGPEDLGLLGAVVVDTQGDHLPALVVEDGALADPRPRPWRSGPSAQSSANGARPLQKVQAGRDMHVYRQWGKAVRGCEAVALARRRTCCRMHHMRLRVCVRV